MTGASGAEAQPAHKGRVTSWLSDRLPEIFEFNPAGVHWPLAALMLDVMLVPLVVFWAIGHEEYLVSALIGAVFTAFADPGGSYGQRVMRKTAFAAIGAGLTALGFGIGGDAWGWLVLAASAVTLVAGLAITFGVHTFVSGFLLNIWFIIALALASGLHHQALITQYTWAQTLAWVGGAALWIAVTFIAWLIGGRRDMPQPVAEIPGDNSRRKLTRPLIAFAVIRAAVMAGTVALAFGLNLSHGFWMPLGAIIAMKPSLEQSTVVGVQRLLGAAIGAGAAALLLLIPANEHGLRLLSITHGLEVVAIVLFMHAVGIRFWNYAAYYAAITAGVLTLLDLTKPSNYGAEGYRLLWTLCGVAIGVGVMLLAGLLSKRTAKAPTQPPAATPPQPAADVPAQRETMDVPAKHKTTAGHDLAISVFVMLLARLLARRKAKAPSQPPAYVPAQRETPAGHDLASRS